MRTCILILSILCILASSEDSRQFHCSPATRAAFLEDHPLTYYFENVCNQDTPGAPPGIALRDDTIGRLIASQVWSFYQLNHDWFLAGILEIAWHWYALSWLQCLSGDRGDQSNLPLLLQFLLQCVLPSSGYLQRKRVHAPASSVCWVPAQVYLLHGEPYILFLTGDCRGHATYFRY